MMRNRTYRKRRTLLGSIGAGALGATAGYLDLEFLESDEPRRFEAEELEPILSTEAPNVARPAPIQPGEGTIASAVDRLETLIDAVPDPLEADDVPNETVRKEIDRTREIAQTRREELTELPSRFHRLRRSIAARRSAGEAATAFEVVSGDRSRNDVETERDEVQERLSNRRSELEYVGDEPQRLLVLASRLETEVASANRRLETQPRDESTDVLESGAIGGATERAAATIEFLTALERRHEDRLRDERSFDGRFQAALDQSLEAIDAAAVPDESTDPAAVVDADVSGTVAEDVLYHGLTWTVGTVEQTHNAAASGETARALRNACAFEYSYRALETIREQIADGSHRALESVGDVRDVRETTLECAADAPFDPDEPTIGGDLLADRYDRFEIVDNRVRGSIERGRKTTLNHVYAEYVVLGAQFSALPEAVAALEERLEA